MELPELPAPAASTCWRCRGAGSRSRKAGPGALISAPCGPCGGSGVLRRAPARVSPRAEKQFLGWPALPVGPLPVGGAPSLLAREEEACYLSGAWRILQRTDAHRYSTDDVVTAWVAWRVGRALGLGAGPICDVGCGLASVLLMSAWLHPGAAAVVGAEAQPARLALAQRSIAYNVGSGGGRPVAALGGDLRAPATHAALLAAAGGGPFSLVTGTPPYFDVAAGGTPPHEESARCLFEYRGGVEAYCAAAAALLAPGGAFCVCESSLSLRRAYEGAAAAGLAVLARVDVVPAPGTPPLFFVLVCGREGGAAADAARAALAAPAAFASPLPLEHLPHAEQRAPGGAFAAYYGAIAAGGGGGGGVGGSDPPPGGHGGAPPPAAAAGAQGGRAKRARLPPHAELQGVPLAGEAVAVLHVRLAGGAGRTPQFRMLLAELGKPSD